MANKETIVLPPHDDRDPVERVLRALEVQALQQKGFRVIIENKTAETAVQTPPAPRSRGDNGDSL